MAGRKFNSKPLASRKASSRITKRMKTSAKNFAKKVSKSPKRK